MNRMPTVFVSHGAPTIVMEPSPAREFLRGLASAVPKPAAILCASAHWEERVPTISRATAPETIHDFYGFPPELYRMRYAAPGAPDLARRAVGLLQAAGIDSSDRSDRGLDHGAWQTMMLAWPDASIPTAQISLAADLDAQTHHSVGRALAPLRDEGVLILGTGGAVHNLRALRRGAPPGVADPWAAAFDEWLVAASERGDVEALVDWERAAPNARMAHPREEHFMPFFVALGAAGPGAKARVLHRSWAHGSLSMTALAWG